MPLETGILTTKLYRSRISGDLVPRPRLLQRLDKWRQRPLTLVVAPAGYGKTTLVSSWLEACDCPSAWLSLSGAVACAGAGQEDRRRKDAIPRNAPGWFEPEKRPKDWQRQT